jgi:hypothetical protein
MMKNIDRDGPFLLTFNPDGAKVFSKRAAGFQLVSNNSGFSQEN